MHGGSDRLEAAGELFFGSVCGKLFQSLFDLLASRKAQFFALRAGSFRSECVLPGLHSGGIALSGLLVILESVLKSVEHAAKVAWQAVPGLFLKVFGYPVKSLRHTAGDTGQCVAVTAQGDGVSDHILEALSFQKSDDRFRHRLLAGFHVVIVGADLIAGPVEVIAEGLRDRRLDLLLGNSVERHKDHGSRRLRAFHSFGMIVGYLRRHGRDTEHLPEVLLAEPGRRRYAHGAPVSEAVIGFRVILVQPHAEFCPVSRKRISVAVFLHGGHKRFFHCLFVCVHPAVHERFRHGQRQDAVVRKLRSLREEVKILRLDIISVELIRASDYISQNSTVHPLIPLFLYALSMRGHRFFDSQSLYSLRTW